MGVFADYSVAWMPPWFRRPFGAKFAQSIGQECDNYVARDQLGVVARYPGYDPASGNPYANVDALPSIAFTRNMTLTGGDADGSKSRAWLLGAFSQNAAGYTASWLPSAAINPQQKVGTSGLGQLADGSFVGGLVWVSPNGGVTGTAFPFPSIAQQGQTVVDNGVTWQWQGLTINQGTANPTPDPLPGWYYGGTNTGLVAALVNAGFWSIDSLGNFVGPRIYDNRHWIAYSPAVAGTIPGVITCASTEAHDPTVAPLGYSWLPDTSQHTVVITIGMSGSTIVIDGGSPISAGFPLSQIFTAPDGSKVLITFQGTFANGDVYVFSPPDHRPGAWSRLWIAVPFGQVLNAPLEWGTGTGGFSAPWGAFPGTSSPPPVPWGTTSSSAITDNLRGQLESICRSWTSGATRTVGIWLVDSTNLQIDGPPTSAWNEESATFGGVIQPFFRLNTDI